jgi:hypothetical protein
MAPLPGWRLWSAATNRVAWMDTPIEAPFDCCDIIEHALLRTAMDGGWNANESFPAAAIQQRFEALCFAATSFPAVRDALIAKGLLGRDGKFLHLTPLAGRALKGRTLLSCLSSEPNDGDGQQQHGLACRHCNARYALLVKVTRGQLNEERLSRSLICLRDASAFSSGLHPCACLQLDCCPTRCGLQL